MFWSCPRLISQVYDVTINPNLLPAPSWRITQQPLCCKAKSFCFKTLLTIRLHTSPPTHNRWIKEVLHGIKLVELLSQGFDYKITRNTDAFFCSTSSQTGERTKYHPLFIYLFLPELGRYEGGGEVGSIWEMFWNNIYILTRTVCTNIYVAKV